MTITVVGHLRDVPTEEEREIRTQLADLAARFGEDSPEHAALTKVLGHLRMEAAPRLVRPEDHFEHMATIPFHNGVVRWLVFRDISAQPVVLCQVRRDTAAGPQWLDDRVYRYPEVDRVPE